MNVNKDVFSRLKRLFSTDVVIRNQGGNQLKVIDVNSIQRSGNIATNSLVDRYSRIYNTNATSLYGKQLNLNYQYLRTQLYSDYDVMDGDAIVASALDIIADESTLKNDLGEVIQIRSSNEDIQKILYNLFYDVLNIEFNLWSWVRQMCKYGDFFLKMEIAEGFGVYNIIPYTAFHIERQENYDEENPSSVRYKFSPEGYSVSSLGSLNKRSAEEFGSIYFDNYEMAHFRLLTDVNYLPYGRSYLEPGRRLFKQYTLMEDAMLIHRIVRAPEKRIFYLNVGGIPPNEVEAFVQKTITSMKRIPYIDQQTGEYNLKFNLQNQLEDFYIPTRGGTADTKIETTKGLEYDGIKDVEYLRDKLFAALKVPKAFLGYEKDLTGKATLAAEDIRFARTIDRIQRIILSELHKIALVHLYTQGYNGEGLTNFELSLTTPSIIYDQERIALLKEKVGLASDILASNLLPTDWIYDNIFHLSEDQYDEYRDLIMEDAKRKFRLVQIENEGNDPKESGKSYGTPHDLAALYGRSRAESTKSDIPDGYDEDVKLGRPEEKVSNINTQDNAFGRDRLGREDNKKDDQPSHKNINFETQTSYLRNKKILESIEKKISIVKKTDEDSLLDESRLMG
jgi:hypothetical protein